MIMILVNGMPHITANESLSYDEVVSRSGLLSDLLTITYRRGKPPKTEGALTPGAFAMAQDGTIFNVKHTRGRDACAPVSSEIISSIVSKDISTASDVDRPSIQLASCAAYHNVGKDRGMATDDLRKGILIGLGFATVQEHIRPAEMFHKLITAWGSRNAN